MKAAPERSSIVCASPPHWRPTPLAALELPDIPTELHFVRDHFPAPAPDLDSWSMELAGQSHSLLLGLTGLLRLPQRTLRVVLECAGHRRAEFVPVPSGVPWGIGAVSEARWTGTSLASLLQRVGIPPGAQEVVLEGADAGPVEGFEGSHRFARSLPLAKALDPDVLVAYLMNGQPIAPEHGGPVRAIVPGWYATDSVKWLDRVWFSFEEFQGVFQAHDYRLETPDDPNSSRRMTYVPVHALITTPCECQVVARNATLRGVAWGGTDGVDRVLVQVDGGPWRSAGLGRPAGAYARVSWELRCPLELGDHEAACRAIDGSGAAQPPRPVANLRGYANNAVHRVRFTAE